MFFQNNDEYKINACMRLELTKVLNERFAQLDYPNTMRGAAERWLAEAEIVGALLEEQQELLMGEVSRRTSPNKVSATMRAKAARAAPRW